ncbi:hypothetical protein A7X12_21755 [Sphingomonas sp. TDK1]|nr:hypothetical protein A7X12_21755 [Sphingomonas sp. TDK1]
MLPQHRHRTGAIVTITSAAGTVMIAGIVMTAGNGIVAGIAAATMAGTAAMAIVAGLFVGTSGAAAIASRSAAAVDRP